MTSLKTSVTEFAIMYRYSEINKSILGLKMLKCI